MCCCLCNELLDVDCIAKHCLLLVGGLRWKRDPVCFKHLFNRLYIEVFLEIRNWLDRSENDKGVSFAI